MQDKVDQARTAEIALSRLVRGFESRWERHTIKELAGYIPPRWLYGILMGILPCAVGP